MYNSDVSEVIAELGDKLPKPQGYKLLIACAVVEQKTSGGVYLPDDLKDREQTASIIGYVLKVGEDAYADSDKFPTGKWCDVGDWVIFRSYSGTRLKIGEQEFRLINDDTVEATVADPSWCTRA